MNTPVSHEWDVSTARAREIQEVLRHEVCCRGEVTGAKHVAGVDVSINRFKKTGTAAVVVLDYPEMTVREVQCVTAPVTFPYVPGLLTFREAPLVLRAWQQLIVKPDLVLVDGQGVAHPRRIGLAAHLGLFLNRPTIGCAKSRLIGEYEEPAVEIGSTSDLTDNIEIIGKVVRTRTGVKPLFISCGHLISLESAVRWTLACCRGYRLPEPTRMAHLAACGNLPWKL